MLAGKLGNKLAEPKLKCTRSGVSMTLTSILSSFVLGGINPSFAEDYPCGLSAKQIGGYYECALTLNEVDYNPHGLRLDRTELRCGFETVILNLKELLGGDMPEIVVSGGDRYGLTNTSWRSVSNCQVVSGSANRTMHGYLGAVDWVTTDRRITLDLVNEAIKNTIFEDGYSYRLNGGHFHIGMARPSNAEFDAFVAANFASMNSHSGGL